MNITSNQELLNLQGKTALVTGAGGGIGWGIAYRLAEAGARVYVNDLHEDSTQQAVKELREKGFDVRALAGDVSQENEVVKMVERIASESESLDILVNNAGIFPFVKVTDLTTELFDKVLAVNTRSVFLTTQKCSEFMKKKATKGKIINITSIDALHPSMIGLAHYDASKHAVWGFTKNSALELAEFGITVNAIAPGGIMTPGVAVAQQQNITPSQLRFPEAPPMEVPLKRMGVPDDIAKTVLFLASPMSDYMTGTQMVVDGGYLLN